MPIERARNTNLIELSRNPVSINSVQAKRSDDSYFTNITNYQLSGRNIRLVRAYDEIKVDYTVEQEDFFDPKISQDVFNNNLTNLNKRNAIAELNSTVFNSQLDRVSANSTQIGNQLGKVLGGFASLVEDAKENTGTNSGPIASIMTDTVPGLTVKKSVSNASDVTTLTGQTAADGLLDIVVCSGNPKGIENALKIALNARDSQVRTAVQQSSPIPERAVAAVKKDIPAEITRKSWEVNQKALRNIGLPFKSNSLLGFGSLGSSFGNILASIVNTVRGVTPAQNFGDVAKPFTDDVEIPAEYSNISNVTEADGSTNVAKTVDEGRLIGPQVRSSESVYRLGQNQSGFIGTNTPNTYVFERVDTHEELEKELRTPTREITAAVVDWTNTYTNNNLDAQLVHKLELQRAIENYGSSYANSLGIDGGIQYHYVIMRDGTIERGRPLNVEVGSSNAWNKRSIYVGFVAGYNAPEGTPNPRSYISSASITPEQMKSFDVFLDCFFKAIPGGEVVGKSDITDAVQNNAPGFDVREYTNIKFNKATIYSNIKSFDQPKTLAEIPSVLPSEAATPIASPIPRPVPPTKIIENKDKTIDPLTGKFTLPTAAELEAASTEFESLVKDVDKTFRSQFALFDTAIKGNDLGTTARSTNKAKNDSLLNNIDTVINSIDANRRDLINNGYVYNEETNTWSKS